MPEDVAAKAARVRRGKNRAKVFLQVDGRRMPSEIAEAAFGSRSEVVLSITSRALRELADDDLVDCINPEERTGRVYRLTPVGMKVRESVARYCR